MSVESSKLTKPTNHFLLLSTITVAAPSSLQNPIQYSVRNGYKVSTLTESESSKSLTHQMQSENYLSLLQNVQDMFQWRQHHWQEKFYVAILLLIETKQYTTKLKYRY